MRRDYCPSRQEQQQLKRKKPSLRSSLKGRSRVSQQELKKRRQVKAVKKKTNRFLTYLISLFLFLAAASLTFFLIRQHWLKRHQLNRSSQILITH